jgi:hypothetical protein
VGKNEGTVSTAYATGRVIGTLNVGGLAGFNFNGSNVTDSYAAANVTGDSNVGGLVGWNKNGTVSSSYAAGRVIGTSNVGGLLGKNGASKDYSGTVSNSYATGRVIADDIIGGLVGRNDRTGSISDSYSTGSVTGSTNIGGLIGKNQGAVTSSFWDTETSGQISSDGGTGKTTAEMKDFDTFDGVWDITTVDDSGTRNTDYIWNIVDDSTYPFLSWQPV